MKTKLSRTWVKSDVLLLKKPKTSISTCKQICLQKKKKQLYVKAVHKIGLLGSHKNLHIGIGNMVLSLDKVG